MLLPKGVPDFVVRFYYIYSLRRRTTKLGVVMQNDSQLVL